MSENVRNQINARLSLRDPQKESLRRLVDVLDKIALGKEVDLPATLANVRAAYPDVTDFERAFPSLCFALATGVGKTRLMGAFITYLYLTGRSKNFLLTLTTLPGDIVLDSFAGSGTTGAVAHKMRRRWIMVELGDHATTHIVPRLKKVIDGQDPGGVTEAVGWKGGGGFRFCRLAPSLIETDQFGQKVISKQYNAEMLAEAMCKHMGFTYSPSLDPALYWRHGHSSGRDFIFVTTQSLTHDVLKALSLEIGDDRTLLICCKAFRARLSDFPNLTVKRIPQAVLDNCEWGRDDYSLNISKPPEDVADEPDDGPDDSGNGSEPGPRRRGWPPRAPQAEAELQAAPVRKLPLKMDGTTRTPRAPRKPPVALPAEAPNAAAKPKSSTKRADKDHSSPKKNARQAKPAPHANGKAVTKQAKRKKATASKPAPKSRTRRNADERQGRLL